MELGTRGIGKTIYNMVLEKKYGQITLNMKANIMKERNMEEDYMFGQMEVNTKVIGMKTE